MHWSQQTPSSNNKREDSTHGQSPDDQYRNQIDYILCSQMWRSSIQSAKTRLGVDCGSDHEFFISKFTLKLKKVGKTIRPFRYDLNQIPYGYTLEVRNIFFFFFFFKFISWRLITILQWFLSYIDMNQPWIYMYSPPPSPLPTPSLTDQI